MAVIWEQDPCWIGVINHLPWIFGDGDDSPNVNKLAVVAVEAMAATAWEAAHVEGSVAL